MAKRAKTDLSNPAHREALPLRTAYYSHALGSKRYLLLRRQARGDVWAARWAGVSSKAIGPVSEIPFEEACAKVYEMARGDAETDTKDLTFGEALDQYELGAAKTKGAASVNTITAHIRRCAPLRDYKISKTSIQTLNKWALSLLTDTSGKATANKIIGTLKAAVNKVHAKGAVQDLPKFKLDRAQEKQAVVMEPHQVQALLRTAKQMDPELWRLVRLLWLTGARPSEITSARHADLSGGSMTLTGKTGTRHITLRPAVASAIKGTIAGTTSHLVEINGRPTTIAQFRYRWDKLVAACGTDVPGGITLYSLRHSFITKGLYSAVPAFAVAAHTGTSVEMISRTYGHVLAAMQSESFAALDEVLCNE